MLRPVLAFLTLCLAAFLLAPTVASVHHQVEDLHFDRDTPFHLWRWSRAEPPTVPFPDCGGKPKQLYSEITDWPAKIRKDETFRLRGVVQNEDENRIGVASIDVDIFLNDTKSEPGVWLGEVESDASGVFVLSTSIPFDLQAEHYHIVAHAKEKRINCTTYLEHWSDPEVDVVSKSVLLFDEPSHPVVGREVELSGRVIDAVGGPVRNASVNLSVAGKTETVVTNEDGRFSLAYRPEKAGNLTLKGNYTGSDFYEASGNSTTFRVAEEDLEIDGQPIALVRSTEATIAGRVYVADAARKDTIAIDLVGINATTCADCPANGTFTVPVADDGSFRLTLTVPSSEAPGNHTFDVRGGGLKKTYTFNLSLDVPSVLAVHGNGTGLFSRGYDGRVVLTDETGAPLAGQPVTLVLPNGTLAATTDAEGAVAFAGSTACGPRTVHATFEGAERVRGSRAQADLYVCGFLAFLPPWLLAIPWWVWPLAIVLAFAGWRGYRAWRERYAPVIVGGPVLTLVFTEPDDDAKGYATIGEAVVATAFLEEPLPDGHRLRIGPRGATEEVPLDAELRARWRTVPDKLGDLTVRAEVVDARDRVVSRRTLTLHVVRYAQEIERRYLALREVHGHGEAVTPREFERWLHERAPGLDPLLARRLVSIFEEADYSPRVAGRAEFAAYLAAEGGVKGVTIDAPMA